MRRPLFFLSLALFVALGGCGKDEAPGEQAAAGEPPAASGLPPAEVTSRPGDAVIEEPGQAVAVEGLFLNPYFDDAGQQTELGVARGSSFRFHVFAETIEPYSTNAIQYRVALPTGVRIVGVEEFEQKNVSLGNPENNYMLAYECQPPGRFRLVTYLCQATAEFAGGEIQVLEGLAGTGIHFIGFVSCEFVEMRATGGTATLTLK